MDERSYFAEFGTDDSITEDEAIALLTYLMPEHGARFISLIKTNGGRHEYRYWSDKYNYGRSVSMALPRTVAEFEQIVRRDLEMPLR